MEKKINTPQMGAGRRLAQRLKEIGKRKPPERLMEILNQKDYQKQEIKKKIAVSAKRKSELDI